MTRIVISLYDFTGEAVRPWALAGYECHIYDIQHPYGPHKQQVGSKGGSITTHRKDLHRPETFEGLLKEYEGKPVAFGMGFPVCTDLAVSGAAHFARKAKANPGFQTDAVIHAVRCSALFKSLKIPFFIENPVSVLATMWRKPDYRFQPYEFGGYIPLCQADHPRWPEYIAARDAYPKKTCLWTGGGFVMPERKPVAVADGYSTQHLKLGGKSQRTKDIRSATPRGFAIAIYEANKG